jgi:hypothetical protein
MKISAINGRKNIKSIYLKKGYSSEMELIASFSEMKYSSINSGKG